MENLSKREQLAADFTSALIRASHLSMHGEGGEGGKFGIVAVATKAVELADTLLRICAGDKPVLVPIPQPADTPLPEGVVVIDRTVEGCEVAGCRSVDIPGHGCNKLREDGICPYCSKKRAVIVRECGKYIACSPCKSWFRIA